MGKLLLYRAGSYLFTLGLAVISLAFFIVAKSWITVTLAGNLASLQQMPLVMIGGAVAFGLATLVVTVWTFRRIEDHVSDFYPPSAEGALDALSLAVAERLDMMGYGSDPDDDDLDGTGFFRPDGSELSVAEAEDLLHNLDYRDDGLPHVADASRGEFLRRVGGMPLHPRDIYDVAIAERRDLIGNPWQVSALDRYGDGSVYIAEFSGPVAELRARRYALETYGLATSVDPAMDPADYAPGDVHSTAPDNVATLKPRKAN